MTPQYDLTEILKLWEDAWLILFGTGARAVNLSQSSGGKGEYTSHRDWAMDFRGYATEHEEKVLTHSKDTRQVRIAATRFIRRVPEDVIQTGIYLQDVV